MPIETNTRKIEQRLGREGWVQQHGANHDKWTHQTRGGTVIVPRHKTVSMGVARNIARGAGWI